MDIAPLHHDTSTTAIDFASGMLGDGLWTAGNSKAKAARHARALEICDFERMLYVHRFTTERAKRDTSHIDAILSELAHEISILAREAIADKSMKLAHFDPWVLTNVAENDEYVRQELASTVLKAAA